MLSFSKRKKNTRNVYKTLNSSPATPRVKNRRITNLSEEEENTNDEKKTFRSKLKQIGRKQQNTSSMSENSELDSNETIDSSLFHGAMLWTSSGIVIVACIFALGFGFFSLTNYVMTHPYFEIKRINIEGSLHFTIDDVVQLSGIEEGANIFSINLNEVEGRILQNPWIESVFIERQLPDTYTIKIEERTPSFWVRYENTLYYVDRNGHLIAPVEPKNFISLPIVELGMGPEEVLAIFPKFLEELNADTFDLPFTVKDIAWFKLSAAKGIEMFWEQQGIIFSIAVDDWFRNAEHIALTIKDLKARNELNRIVEIHAGNEQVWYTPQ